MFNRTKIMKKVIVLIIFLIVKTSYSQDNNEKTVYEGYNRGMSGFAYSEDILINVKIAIAATNLDLEKAKKEGSLFIIDILKDIETETISVKELDNLILKYTIANPDKFEGDPSPENLRWPRGSDHGCCGNYQGPCLYWHSICWVHDKVCLECTPKWFCGPACKYGRFPTPCEINPSSPDCLNQKK
jgi:hypothetical protein